MKRYFILFLIVLVPFFAKENDIPPLPAVNPKTHQLLLDYHLSPKAAGSTMLSIHNSLESAMDKVYKLDQPNTTQICIRFAEMFFGWMPLNRLTMVTQHEVFGHGYRLREFGPRVGLVDGYVVKLPFPYGYGGGATSFFPIKMGPMHKATVSLAGMEGTSILAKELKMGWFEQGVIDPRQAYLYVTAQHDPTFYTLVMKNTLPSAGKGHDMESYLYILRRIYPGSKLSVNQLKMLSLVNLVDPMTYNCFNAMWHYVNTGQAFEIGHDYLWNMRLGLAPYGPETYVEHHRLVDGKPIYSYIKGGQFAQNRYYGCGAEHRNIWESGPHKVGLRADLWIHPKLNFKTNGYTSATLYDPAIKDYGLKPLGNQLGCALTGAYAIQSSGSFGAELHLGFKTPGYLPGESLASAPIVRGSIHFKF
ncbi:MAG: hypothetical protein H7A39_01600 [Chlamydiales bacterium]|nr:hypothetical protein [Chlamydiales bacterium]